MANLTMYRGDTRTVVFTFAGSTQFQVGDTVRFTLKRSVSDPDSAALAALVSPATVTLDGTTATATIPAAATSTLAVPTVLAYDWQLTTTAGAVHTLDAGRIAVHPDVTRTA